MSSDPGDGPPIIPFGPEEHALLLEWGELTGQVDNPVHNGEWLFYRCDAAHLKPGAPGFTYELFGRRVDEPQAFPPILEVNEDAQRVFYAAWRVRIYLGHPEPLDAPLLDAPFLERTSHLGGTYRYGLGGWTELPSPLQIEAVYAGAPALGATEEFDEIMAAARSVGIDAVSDKAIASALVPPITVSALATKKHRAGQLTIPKIKQLLLDESLP
jgi:hypothetical protein